MSRVKGHYNGSIVILDEPPPVKDEVTVYVDFPERRSINGAGRVPNPEKKWHWRTERLPGDTWEGCVSDEVIRQRRED